MVFLVVESPESGVKSETLPIRLFRSLFSASEPPGPKILKPLDSDLRVSGHHRSTWLSLIVFFYSPKFFLPGFRLAYLPLTHILTEHLAGPEKFLFRLLFSVAFFYF